MTLGVGNPVSLLICESHLSPLICRSLELLWQILMMMQKLLQIK
jgi:hypothetical protein